MAVTRGPTPEERELEKKKLQLDALQKQLVERELELETMRGGLIAFEKKYQDATTQRYAMLDEIHFRIAELRAQKNPTEPSAQVAATVKMAAMAMPSMPGGPRPKRKPPKPQSSTKDAPGAGGASGFNPSEELKRLYRDVAKAMHPDFANDEQERAHRHTFMARANEAYEANHEQRLVAILNEWHCAPESVRGKDPGAELIRTIRTVARCEDRLTQIEVDMGKMETAGIFGIKMLADEADKLERDFLNEMTSRLDEEIEAAKAYLLKMGGKVPDPSELKPPEEPASPDFDTEVPPQPDEG